MAHDEDRRPLHRRAILWGPWAWEPWRGIYTRYGSATSTIEFLGGCVNRRAGCKVPGLELASQELFHVMKEMEAWLQDIEDET